MAISEYFMGLSRLMDKGKCHCESTAAIAKVDAAISEYSTGLNLRFSLHNDFFSNLTGSTS